jgi:hypothetical protein
MKKEVLSVSPPVGLPIAIDSMGKRGLGFPFTFFQLAVSLIASIFMVLRLLASSD